MPNPRLWERYKNYLCQCPEIGLFMDISRMNFPEGFFKEMEPIMQMARGKMNELENGAIANPDEERMVGHYWLRNPGFSPSPETRAAIEEAIKEIKAFAGDIHSGRIRPAKAERFTRILVIGIGGSALGPQFIADALANPTDPMTPYFFDNTDPDGFDRTLAEIGSALKETLTIVISKSGGTKETRNGLLEAREAYRRSGLDFPGHAVAITAAGSQLDREAERERWLKRFPMWDWVGGRTSATSAVGLVPASLQGFDIDALLNGARRCDELTRKAPTMSNPAALLALMWHHATGGQGLKDMVILPYKDRLLLFSRYLQQLVMESLGKKYDLDGAEVNQGINVFGNKGTTDQHAYVQQLRDGLNNFFVTFIEVLRDRNGKSIAVEDSFTSGDFLNGFLNGTRRALHDGGRESITITIEKIDAWSIGVLIALYERAVGFYASLININAYHQPGVEAGKKAAEKILILQTEVLNFLRSRKNGESLTAEEIAEAVGNPDEVESIFKILLHAAANVDHGVTVEKTDNIIESRFR
ncbi:MAG TPA: glucose-6-phosphate isomerase [Geobacteraceae bacterium]|nr:glucose-6-phosphate isomerase [Geobacteraceae bacterium]